jgi:hypothetical protein
MKEQLSYPSLPIPNISPDKEGDNVWSLFYEICFTYQLAALNANWYECVDGDYQ